MSIRVFQLLVYFDVILILLLIRLLLLAYKILYLAFRAADSRPEFFVFISTAWL